MINFTPLEEHTGLSFQAVMRYCEMKIFLTSHCPFKDRGFYATWVK